MRRRTLEDWENVSQRIYHISNDSMTIAGLKNEFVYLGGLDVMINEMCDESLSGSAKINIFPRITMLSRLWMMHAYEVVRSLDEFDRTRSEASGGNLANFKTNRFCELKKKLAKIRIPMAKQEKTGGKGSGSAYFDIENAGKRCISFVSDGEEIEREKTAQEVFDVVNNYERNPKT